MRAGTRIRWSSRCSRFTLKERAGGTWTVCCHSIGRCRTRAGVRMPSSSCCWICTQRPWSSRRCGPSTRTGPRWQSTASSRSCQTRVSQPFPTACRRTSPPASRTSPPPPRSASATCSAAPTSTRIRRCGARPPSTVSKTSSRASSPASAARRCLPKTGSPWWAGSLSSTSTPTGWGPASSASSPASTWRSGTPRGSAKCPPGPRAGARRRAN
mmetsp:Transcript_37195/g.90341  ORF Transcript_37195/g.90341 Transcript_37195/m.90341 type:complete len:213 (+) Transcript_37195:596-1234(+)